MTNPYPTETQARERELARILWQKQEIQNAIKQLRANPPYDPEGINADIREQLLLDELRAKLTSWPVMFCKRYEVARALIFGWWHQNTAREKGCIADMVLAVVASVSLLALVVWLSLR